MQSILKDIFGIHASLGMISDVTRRVSERFESTYNDLVESVRQSPLIHIDETGHRFQGKRGWAWVFGNMNVTVLKLAPSRGSSVVKEMLPHSEALIITDRYSSYHYWNQDKRQVCWAHLMRDFERLAMSSHAQVSVWGRQLTSLGKKMFCLREKLKTQQIRMHFFQKQCEKIKQKMIHCLGLVIRKGGSKRASGVCKNILKCTKMMWHFLKDPLGIEPTNNFAERHIRKYVTYRKTSLFSWASWGERFIERMMSIYLSFSKTNPFQLFYNILASPKPTH